MEHYRRLGLAAAIRKLGLPQGQATDVAYFTRLDGYELARLCMPSEAQKMRAPDCAARAGSPAAVNPPAVSPRP